MEPKFRDYKAELGLSGRALARALGVSNSTISDYAKACPEAVLECMAAWVLYKRRLEALGLMVRPKPKRGTPRAGLRRHGY